jgi:hypothetical protein
MNPCRRWPRRGSNGMAPVACDGPRHCVPPPASETGTSRPEQILREGGRTMCTRLMAMAMVVSLATLIGPARAGQLDPNLAGWWRFDDGAGTTAVDSSGQERHGELIGGPQWTAGMRKGALAFSGSSHVAIPGYDGIMGGHARTTAAWIKVENTSASIITWGPTGGGTKWVMRTHNGPASLRVECGQSQIIGTIDLAPYRRRAGRRWLPERGRDQALRRRCARRNLRRHPQVGEHFGRRGRPDRL